MVPQNPDSDRRADLQFCEVVVRSEALPCPSFVKFQVVGPGLPAERPHQRLGYHYRCNPLG